MLLDADFNKMSQMAYHSRSAGSSRLTMKMKSHELANQLQNAANQIGVYKQAIEQKKYQKEAMKFKIEQQKAQTAMMKNTAKQVRVANGKLRQKLADEWGHQNRIGALREAVLTDSNSCFKLARDSNKGLKEARNLREELIGRMEYEKKLIDTLNKIVQKLNFERNEAVTNAHVLRVENTQAYKLRSSL